ncbi:hypothetical protein MMC26_002664 [Xylographa opegraphella]|nr:hypothetical protein [Xylographa opegraphella]
MLEDSNREIVMGVKQLAAERDTLRAKLNVANSVLEEQQRMIDHQETMLNEAHALLSHVLFRGDSEAVSAGPSYDRTSNPEWINVTWLSLPVNRALLGRTEEAFRRGARQEALNSISTILSRNDLRPVERVYAKLLLSELLRSSGNLTASLLHTDQALEIARGLHDYRLGTVVQFYRGLCFLHLNRYTDASWCFIYAMDTKDYKEQVELHWSIADRARKNIHPTDPRRMISESF